MPRISVAEMTPERPNPAEETGFASGLQAALVHNGLYLFLTPSGSDLVRSPPTDSFLPTVRQVEHHRLHHQRQILQFVLQHRQRAPRHFHPSDRIQGSLWRHAVAPPHQKDLKELGSLMGIGQTSLQEIVSQCREFGTGKSLFLSRKSVFLSHGRSPPTPTLLTIRLSRCRLRCMQFACRN